MCGSGFFFGDGNECGCRDGAEREVSERVLTRVNWRNDCPAIVIPLGAGGGGGGVHARIE